MVIKDALVGDYHSWLAYPSVANRLNIVRRDSVLTFVNVTGEIRHFVGQDFEIVRRNPG